MCIDGRQQKVNFFEIAVLQKRQQMARILKWTATGKGWRVINFPFFGLGKKRLAKVSH